MIEAIKRKLVIETLVLELGSIEPPSSEPSSLPLPLLVVTWHFCYTAV